MVAFDGFILTEGDRGSWDDGSAGFLDVFKDPGEPTKTYLFYSGWRAGTFRQSKIGMAVGDEFGNGFVKKRDPIIESDADCFYKAEALSPAVVRCSNRYYMAFGCRPHSLSRRRIGLAFADDPDGPWQPIKELITPQEPWEGIDIDNGPAIVRKDDEILLFYSSVCSLGAWIRKAPLGLFWSSLFHPVRKIGILKIRIRGSTRNQVECYRWRGNPLNHLNGSTGAWNESVFCPGYLWSSSLDLHVLFPAAATYSRELSRQSIGMVVSRSIEFDASHTLSVSKLLDSSALPGGKAVSFDTPDPLLDERDGTAKLFFAASFQGEKIWRVGRATLQDIGKKAS